MDESQQKEVDAYPLWYEHFEKVRDELIRTETRLATIISIDKTKFDPYDAAKAVVGLVAAVS